jgi:hypothetical protein
MQVAAMTESGKSKATPLALDRRINWAALLAISMSTSKILKDFKKRSVFSSSPFFTPS